MVSIAATASATPIASGAVLSCATETAACISWVLAFTSGGANGKQCRVGSLGIVRRLWLLGGLRLTPHVRLNLGRELFFCGLVLELQVSNFGEEKFEPAGNQSDCILEQSKFPREQ